MCSGKAGRAPYPKPSWQGRQSSPVLALSLKRAQAGKKQGKGGHSHSHRQQQRRGNLPVAASVTPQQTRVMVPSSSSPTSKDASAQVRYDSAADSSSNVRFQGDRADGTMAEGSRGGQQGGTGSAADHSPLSASIPLHKGGGGRESTPHNEPTAFLHRADAPSSELPNHAIDRETRYNDHARAGDVFGGSADAINSRGSSNGSISTMGPPALPKIDTNAAQQTNRSDSVKRSGSQHEGSVSAKRPTSPQ